MQGLSIVTAVVFANLWARLNALGVTDYKPVSSVSFVVSHFANFKIKEKTTAMSACFIG